MTHTPVPLSRFINYTLESVATFLTVMVGIFVAVTIARTIDK